MECTIDWQGPGGMLFVTRTGSGHVLAMDGAPDGGGNNLAPRPMEAMLSGAGGCAAYDVVLILQRSRQQISGCRVKLSAERASTEPKVFTKIHYHFEISGKDIPLHVAERAVRLSHEKYCSAIAMLEKTATISSSIELLNAC